MAKLSINSNSSISLNLSGLNQYNYHQDILVLLLFNLNEYGNRTESAQVYQHVWDKT